MSNIEKLLDSLLRIEGEKLVINTQEPIHVLKSNQKTVLINKVINANEFGFLEAEYAKVFNGAGEFPYKNHTLYSRRDGYVREFLLSSKGVREDALPARAPVVEKVSPAPPDAAPPPPAPPAAVPSAASPVEPPAPAASNDGSLDLDMLLRLMDEKGASDLHISSQCRPAMRIDGDMVNLDEMPEVSEAGIMAEFKRISPARNVEEFAECNDTDFAYALDGVGRFRANIFRDLRGPGAVFRIIPSKILTVEDLQVPWAMVDLCEIPKGLILVTGPTGSGKSTTLAALINHINETQRKHIITVEDPVEFVHPNKLSLVNQREINTHTDSFKKALRAALREDPDIILVGEMRDLETIAIAVEMAITGHLVFGTLHTSTAIGTVDRIIDQFPSDQQSQIRTMLSDALIGVVSQTLLKRKKGGRVGAYEVLVITPAVSNLIREGKNFQIATLMQTGKKIGMQMINSHLSEIVEKGIAAPDEAISKAIDKEALRTMLQGKGLLPADLQKPSQ